MEAARRTSGCREFKVWGFGFAGKGFSGSDTYRLQHSNACQKGSMQPTPRIRGGGKVTEEDVDAKDDANAQNIIMGTATTHTTASTTTTTTTRTSTTTTTNEAS